MPDLTLDQLIDRLIAIKRGHRGNYPVHLMISETKTSFFSHLRMYRHTAPANLVISLQNDTIAITGITQKEEK